MTATTDLPPAPKAPSAPVPKPRLGEELPIFCERCGYSLHGLTPLRCGHCQILHFHCPECGHHQPINTLRPAFQVIFGKLRAAFLVLEMLWLLVIFGLACFAWAGMGAAWSYTHHYHTLAQPAGLQPRYVAEFTAQSISYEMLLAFGVFGLAYGTVARMLLLRWRRGYAVGLVLAALALATICIGAWIRRSERGGLAGESASLLPTGMLIASAMGCCAIVLGATIAWPIWCGLVAVFLPKRTGQTLLEWQRAQSDRSASPLARDKS